MKLDRYLKPSRIILHMNASNKWIAIEQLLSRLIEDGLVADPDQARRDVVDREKRMSTGLKDGLAIPHAKTKGVNDLVLALGVAPDGVEFESLDGQPAHILFLALSRADVSGPHVECLAEIAKLCSDARVRNSILSAHSAEDILDILRR